MNRIFMICSFQNEKWGRQKCWYDDILGDSRSGHALTGRAAQARLEWSPGRKSRWTDSPWMASDRFTAASTRLVRDGGLRLFAELAKSELDNLDAETMGMESPSPSSGRG